MWDKLEETEKRYEELTREMGRPEVAADFQRLQSLAKDRASLQDIVELYRQFKRLDAALTEARAMAEDGSDPELAALARDETAGLTQERDRLEQEIRLALAPKDRYDERNVIV